MSPRHLADYEFRMQESLEPHNMLFIHFIQDLLWNSVVNNQGIYAPIAHDMFHVFAYRGNGNGKGKPSPVYPLKTTRVICIPEHYRFIAQALVIQKIAYAAHGLGSMPLFP